MKDSQLWLLKEYEVLRLEITERVKLLHQFIALGVIASIIALIIGTLLFAFSAATNTFLGFLLFVPVIFAGLTFNYQANQMTFEGLAYYVNDSLRAHVAHKDNPAQSTWDSYYNDHKISYRMTSFFKVLPLLFPQIIPFFVLYYYGWPQHGGLAGLLVFDLVLFVLVVINFRYKLRS